MSRRSGSGKCAGSRFAAPSAVSTSEPRGILRPSSSTSVLVMRPVRCTGLSYRRSSSTAPGSNVGSARNLASWGVIQQRQETVANEVDGGLVAGDEQQIACDEQFALGQPVPLLFGRNQ